MGRGEQQEAFISQLLCREEVEHELMSSVVSLEA
jgi:hypothetical protein